MTKILEEKRKLRLQRQRRGLFTLWTEFSAGEYSGGSFILDSDGGSGDIFYRDIDDFTLVLEVGKLCVLCALGEMEESSFFKTATTTATKSERSGKSVSAKKDDEGEQENPIDSYAKVARHLNHNDTTVNKSSVSPSSSSRSRTLTTWAFPNRSPRLLKDVRSYHQPSLTNDNNTKNNKKKQTTSRLSLNIRATKNAT